MRPLPAGGPSLPGFAGRKRWRLRETPLRGRLQHLGLPPMVAQLLENRGIGSSSEVKLFLGGEPTKFCNPELLPGFVPARDVLRDAIKDRRLISVYGDFDVDGITSTTILTETIRDLGGKAMPYIPNREREGYGLNVRAVESLADRGVEVMVTCDCGSTSVVEIERARELGMEVVVVDHHVVPTVIPPAQALLNPKMPAEAGAFSDYASGGVTFRLAEALYDACHRAFPEERYIELAALATVADMVPLVGENREIVRRGLVALANTKRPGLQALMQVAGIDPRNVSAETIGFQIGPRINATGRLADARLALELLLTEEEGTAFALAEQVDALNKERQRITKEAEEMAREMADRRGDLPLMLIGHADFHQGIIGLVASRLVESFGRPAVVFQQGDAESRGSCRSIPEYDIVSGLRHCGDLFERYGGHRQAGGFTIRSERLADLEQRLIEHAADALDGMDLVPNLDIDAEVPLGQLRSAEIKWLGRLAPHGQGNPDVTLLSRNVLVTDASMVGEGKHLKLKLKAGPVSWPAICFRYEGECPQPGDHIDAVFSFSSDRFGPAGNGGALQLTVVDLAPSL
ncbi:MAG: single-stranded-DNA-specific exonuclease RecJ [Dehalococcoidia bacterium]